MTVVRLIERDHRVSRLPQAFDIVRTIVNVGMRSNVRFLAHKTNIPIRNALLIEPLGSVGNCDGMPPVDVQTMRDDADPNTGV